MPGTVLPRGSSRILRLPLCLLLCLATGLLLAAPSGVVAAQARELPPYHPSRLTHLGDSRQVVVVTSGSWGSSYAKLRTYGRTRDGVWRLRLGPVDARIGGNGFSPAATRRQATSTTPAGTFAIPWAFGTRADPGTDLTYRRVDADDWWPYDPRDPSTYNVWQPRRVRSAAWRTSWAEDLDSFGRQYRHAAVIAYNLPSGVRADGGQQVAEVPADTRRGGGIFLHIDRPGSTAGCVSVAQADLVRILRWLDPGKGPVIVMGPRSEITRM